MNATPLTFTSLDGLAFAAARGRLSAIDTTYAARSLGPLMEWRQLSLDGLLPPPGKSELLQISRVAAFNAAMGAGHSQWIDRAHGSVGFYRTRADWSDDDTEWIGFGVAVQRAATAIGFHRRIAARFAAALGELAGNIQEHSGASPSGIVAFSAVDRTFEFVVADHGIGVLNSLRSAPDYATLADHGTALQLALTDGVSRYGKEAKRGKGFRPIFIGLANLTGSLRFRTGDHALTIEDQTIDLMLSKTAQKVELKGFLISVACRL
jgi:anti-sigma regulatory factor (Ser/Thr protein kinase)